MRRGALLLLLLISLLTTLASASHGIHDAYKRDDHAVNPSTHSKTSTSVSGISTTPNNHELTVCGNGVVEHGEECDCGSPEECAKDPCCNSKTCKLAPGAQCSNKQDCCNQCQFRPSTFVCRAATSSCDTLEMCTGKSGKCPANKKECNKHASNSTISSTATCGATQCTGRDLQCQAQSTADLKFTMACTETLSSCQMGCSSSNATTSGASGCATLSSYFTDGTECGQGGLCSNGVCTGDQNNASFLKKNATVLAIGGSCFIAAIAFGFLGFCCIRRRKKNQSESEKEQGNSYPMTETSSFRGNRRSNIRIGLDPIDIRSSLDNKSYLTRRISTGLNHVQASRPYALDSLMTEQDMALELESDTHQRLGPSVSTWPTTPISNYRSQQPTYSTWKEPVSNTLQKSGSNHTIYVPPPLPPVSPSRIISAPSPYADDAMIIHPPENPPVLHQPISSAFSSTSRAMKSSAPCSNETRSRSIGKVIQDDDEPSVLNLDCSLTVDRYTKTSSQAAKDRASVSSFFSTLAVDPEPIPPLPSFTPLLPDTSYTTDEFIIPAPVARVVPPNAPRRGASSKSSSKGKAAVYDKKQEEIQVAAGFAHDLGFEIVNPSPATSPRKVVPSTRQRLE